MRRVLCAISVAAVVCAAMVGCNAGSSSPSPFGQQFESPAVPQGSQLLYHGPAQTLAIEMVEHRGGTIYLVDVDRDTVVQSFRVAGRSGDDFMMTGGTDTERIEQIIRGAMREGRTYSVYFAQDPR